MIKTRYFVIAFAAVLAVCLAAILFTRGSRNASVARISQNGKIVAQIDLNTVVTCREIPVATEAGYNLIVVEPGRICVSEADCPDRICVQQGWSKSSATPIVCLPHGLMIEVSGNDGLDAVSE